MFFLPLSAVPFAAACIFDSGGDYQGGGRRSTSAATTEITEPTPTPTPGVDAGGATPFRDAGSIRDANVTD